MNTAPKKRGRPPGSKTGPRVGSRPHMLLSMKPGDVAWLEAPRGRLNAFQVQVAADITRNGLRGLITQTFVIGVEPSTREVHELVMLVRRAAP